MGRADDSFFRREFAGDRRKAPEWEDWDGRKAGGVPLRAPELAGYAAGTAAAVARRRAAGGMAFFGAAEFHAFAAAATTAALRGEG